MDNRNISIKIHKNWEYPIRVNCPLPKKYKDHEVLDGEFNFDHTDYLWGMLKRYADVEGLELEDLKITIYEAFSNKYDDFVIRMILLKTKDGRDWFDAPELFKFVE